MKKLIVMLGVLLTASRAFAQDVPALVFTVPTEALAQTAPVAASVANPHSGLMHLGLGAFMIGNGIDLSGTMYCIGAGHCVELNPLLAPLQHRPVLFGAVKTGMIVGLAKGMHELHKTHPKAAFVLSIAGGAFYTYHGVRAFRIYRGVGQ